MPFSSQWKWSGLTLNGSSYVIGAPDVLTRAGALTLPEGLQRALDEHTARRPPGDRLRRGARRRCPPIRPPQPPPALEPRALVVLEETLRPDAAETIAYMRDQQVDLKLISGDARETVTAVAHAVGVPADAGVIEGSELPDRQGRARRGRASATRSSAGSPPSRRRRWSARSPTAAGSRR